MSDFEKTVKIYNELLDACPDIERKGKTVPYTSANGHMFSLINKEGELGFRYDKKVQEKYMQEWPSDYLKSHGATMRGYVKIPEHMLKDLTKLKTLLEESKAYVLSLPPK